jgi:glycogen debranching enzyme
MVELRRTVRDASLLPGAPREWLVANGLGGYASATITGAITRRYHGLLIAAQPPPLGRMVVLEDLEVDIELEDGSIAKHARERSISRFYVEHGSTELAIRARWGRH